MVAHLIVDQVVAGSSPAVSAEWACSSVGRAPHLHCGGRRFDAFQVHFNTRVFLYKKTGRNRKTKGAVDAEKVHRTPHR